MELPPDTNRACTLPKRFARLPTHTNSVTHMRAYVPIVCGRIRALCVRPMRLTASWISSTRALRLCSLAPPQRSADPKKRHTHTFDARARLGAFGSDTTTLNCAHSAVAAVAVATVHAFRGRCCLPLTRLGGRRWTTTQ